MARKHRVPNNRISNVIGYPQSEANRKYNVPKTALNNYELDLQTGAIAPDTTFEQWRQMQRGVGVAIAYKDVNDHLILNFTDGTIVDVGNIKGDAFTYEDFTPEQINGLVSSLQLDLTQLKPIANGALPTPSGSGITMKVVGGSAGATWTHATLPSGSASLLKDQTGEFYWNGTSWALTNVVDLPIPDLTDYVKTEQIKDVDWQDVTGSVTSGYRPRATTGVVEATSGYKCTDPIAVDIGDELEIYGYSFSTTSALIVCYDESMTKISDIERGTGVAQYFDNYLFSPTFKGFIIATGREGGAYNCAVRRKETYDKFALKTDAATKTEVNVKQNISDNSLLTDSKTIPTAINELKELTDEFFEDEYENIPITITTGFYKYDDGVLTTGSYRSSQKIVIDSAKYLINGSNSSNQTGLIVEWDDEGNYIGYRERGIGSVIMYTDYIYTPSANAHSFATVAITSDVNRLSVRKFIGKVSKSYDKTQSDDRYVLKSSYDDSKYGIKWQISSTSYLAERTFNAIGKFATPAIGTGGSSDFDSIYPWSEIKRVNIQVLSTGAKKLTYEGEVGFTTNGTNGDVFVEIPIFRYKREVKDGFEHRTISKNEGDIHPAFIEDGKIVQKIYVASYESVLEGGDIKSKAGLMPLNNVQPQDMLNLAKAKGYSLYDWRTVDVIQNLMWIEYANINSAMILGNGWSDMIQPDETPAKTAIVAETGANRIILDATVYNTTSLMANFKERAFPGANIIICKGSHQNILGYRKVVSVTNDATQLIVNFDGAPIDIDIDCYFGNGPQDTGIVDSLPYHTGRTNRAKVDVNSTVLDIRKNPNRYRYIENISGNVWHYLPDITFVNGVPYVSNNINDYEFWKTTGSYKPIALKLPEQAVNTDGNWILTLAYDHICQYSFGATFGAGAYNQKTGGFYYMNYGSQVCTVNGGGFDHRERCNIATNRSWITPVTSNVAWYLYGCRLTCKIV